MNGYQYLCMAMASLISRESAFTSWSGICGHSETIHLGHIQMQVGWDWLQDSSHPSGVKETS